ncbi:hypothetical protein ACLXBB_36855, partial [Pseudomonas aeruginosa]
RRRPIGTEQANGAEAGSKSARLVKRPVRNDNPEHATPRPWGGWRRTSATAAARPCNRRRPIGTEQANGAEAGSKSARLVKRPVRNDNP